MLVQGKVAYEGEILEKIQQQGSSSNHAGSSHVLGLRDHFNLTSNHGSHLCLVTDVLGSTFGEMQSLFVVSHTTHFLFKLSAAFFNGTHADMIQPIALRALEVTIGCGWDQRADIWNLGCLIGRTHASRAV